MADDILFHTFLLVVLLWLCLSWYWMRSRNHLAPYPGQRKPATFAMALWLYHARMSSVQSVCIMHSRSIAPSLPGMCNHQGVAWKLSGSKKTYDSFQHLTQSGQGPGQMKKACIHGNEALPRSAIRRLGRLRGWPTATVSRVVSRRVTSAGDAASRYAPHRAPAPSTRTRHFGPLPRLVVPTLAPLFGRDAAAIGEAFIPAELLLVVELGQEGPPEFEQAPARFPPSGSGASWS
jgi:hypothetical protein